MCPGSKVLVVVPTGIVCTAVSAPPTHGGTSVQGHTGTDRAKAKQVVGQERGSCHADAWTHRRTGCACRNSPCSSLQEAPYSAPQDAVRSFPISLEGSFPLSAPPSAEVHLRWYAPACVEMDSSGYGLAPRRPVKCHASMSWTCHTSAPVLAVNPTQALPPVRPKSRTDARSTGTISTGLDSSSTKIERAPSVEPGDGQSVLWLSSPVGPTPAPELPRALN